MMMMAKNFDHIMLYAVANKFFVKTQSQFNPIFTLKED